MTAGWGAGEWSDMAWGTGDDYPYGAIDITYIDCIVGPPAIDCIAAPSIPLNASEMPTYAAIGSTVPPDAIEGTP